MDRGELTLKIKGMAKKVYRSLGKSLDRIYSEQKTQRIAHLFPLPKSKDEILKDLNNYIDKSIQKNHENNNANV